MNTKKRNFTNYWMGLAKIKARNYEILGAQNAYVNVIAIANSRSNFRKKVKQALSKMNLELKRLEEAENISERTKRSFVDKKILQLVDDLNRTKKEVKFSVFHTYD
jgi:hypothetical protein